MKKSALQPLELITEQNNAAFGLKIGGENMTNRIEVTPEQLASLLLINIAITDLLEQGAPIFWKNWKCSSRICRISLHKYKIQGVKNMTKSFIDCTRFDIEKAKLMLMKIIQEINTDQGNNYDIRLYAGIAYSILEQQNKRIERVLANE